MILVIVIIILFLLRMAYLAVREESIALAVILLGIVLSIIMIENICSLLLQVASVCHTRRCPVKEGSNPSHRFVKQMFHVKHINQIRKGESI